MALEQPGKINNLGTLEQSIIDEARRLKRENPEKWLGFLNNFWTIVLPEKNEIFITPREGSKKLGWWDKKREEVLLDENKKKHSKLRLGQTDQEFYETIDRVIAEVDINGEIRSAIQKLCDTENYNKRGEVQDILEEKLIPVFARLVAMGYSKLELTE